MSIKKRWQEIKPEKEPDWVNNKEADIPFLEIFSEDIGKEIKIDKFQIIDVRNKWEYDRYYIPGAILIPIQELEERFNEIDPDKKTILVCEHGIRSANACCFLNYNGMKKENIHNLDGGMACYIGKVTSNLK